MRELSATIVSNHLQSRLAIPSIVQVLLICTGTGSPVAFPKVPKGTAFLGEGPHIPANPEQDVLFGIRKQFTSLHELFEEVERLLNTL